jgi:LPXTG-motif cell wall-anchored protein
MYDDIGTANADHDLNVGTDVTEIFEIMYPVVGEACACGSTCSFKVVGDIYDVVNANTMITPATVFVVYYEADLLETAKLGNPGNPNKMHLEYSNDPYDATKTGFTAEDTVVVFTYSFTVQKVDQDGAALPGAGFTLYKLDANGSKNKIGEMLGGEGSNLTEFTWTGLDDGDYVLEETVVPKGFNGMAAREFSIYADHDLTSDAPQLTSLGSTSFVGNTDDGTIVAQVANRTGAALPETGAEGTFFLITSSTLLVLVAAVFMITRKKMSIYED